MSSKHGMTSRRAVLGGIAGSIGIAGIGMAGAADEPRSEIASDTPAVTDIDQSSTPTTRFSEIYEQTIDGVVLVTRSLGTDSNQPGGIGSGFVYDDEYLITNQHVVGDSETVDLQFSDEQWSEANVVGTDMYSDLAVLEAESQPDGVTDIPLSDDDPVIGEEVLALGNPLGLDASLSQGIVSGTDRSIPSPTGFAIPATIQTDTPVNPGNSGGPLVDLDGRVIGVVVAGAGPGGTIGFAISAQLVGRVVPALLEAGTYEHPYMGVSVIPVGPQVAKANELDDPGGVLVMDTTPESPAADVFQSAELERIDGQQIPIGGDVIVAIDDEAIPNQDRLASYLVLETSPGQTVEVDIIRDGKEEAIDITLDERPTPEDIDP